MYRRLYGTMEGRNVVLNPVPSQGLGKRFANESDELFDSVDSLMSITTYTVVRRICHEGNRCYIVDEI